MDKKKLMAEANKIITPALLAQFKAEIATLGHNSGSLCDCNCEKCRGEHQCKPQKLTEHIKGCFLGDLDDHRVFAVDADKVMLFYYADFVVAGNPERYPDFIPKGQFWVDHCFVDKTKGDFRHDLLHESVEARMMKAWGKDSYDDRAHPAANEFELAYMRELGLDKDEDEEKSKAYAKAIADDKPNKPKASLTIAIGKLPWQGAVPLPAPATKN